MRADLGLTYDDIIHNIPYLPLTMIVDEVIDNMPKEYEGEMVEWTGNQEITNSILTDIDL